MQKIPKRSHQFLIIHSPQEGFRESLELIWCTFMKEWLISY